jgi:hypothetical protein
MRNRRGGVGGLEHGAGIDLGFVSLELARLTVTTEAVRRAVRYCQPAISVAGIVSE